MIKNDTVYFNSMLLLKNVGLGEFVSSGTKNQKINFLMFIKYITHVTVKLKYKNEFNKLENLQIPIDEIADSKLNFTMSLDNIIIHPRTYLEISVLLKTEIKRPHYVFFAQEFEKAQTVGYFKNASCINRTSSRGHFFYAHCAYASSERD
jgi:hypothetical protein